MAERPLLVPPVVPWVLILLLAGFDKGNDPNRWYTIVVHASYAGVLLYTTILCLLLGRRSASRLRAYWIFVGFLTLMLGGTSAALVVAELLFLLVPLALVGVLIMLARSLSSWFSQRPREPSPRVHGHLASALTLLFFTVFPGEFLRTYSTALRNPAIKLVPLLWILLAVLAAHRSAVKDGTEALPIVPIRAVWIGLLTCTVLVLLRRPCPPGALSPVSAGQCDGPIAPGTLVVCESGPQTYLAAAAPSLDRGSGNLVLLAFHSGSSHRRIGTQVVPASAGGPMQLEYRQPIPTHDWWFDGDGVSDSTRFELWHEKDGVGNRLAQATYCIGGWSEGR